MKKKILIGVCSIFAVLFINVFIQAFPLYNDFLQRFSNLTTGDAILCLILFYVFQVGFWFLFNFAFDVASFKYEKKILNDRDPKIPSASRLPNQEKLDYYIENVVIPSKTNTDLVDSSNLGIGWLYISGFFSLFCLFPSAAIVASVLHHPLSTFASLVLFAISCYLGRFFYKKTNFFSHLLLH